MQVTVKNLLLEVPKLFANKRDVSLHKLKDFRAMLCSLGIYTVGQKRKYG